MRIVFGILSLLVVLAIIGSLAKKQLQAVSVPAIPGADSSAPALSGTPAQQSQQLQRKVEADVGQALQQGASRNEGAY